MSLPKINTPEYRLTIPSTDEEITYRPFLVKEEKLLLIAQETGTDTATYDAIKQIITSKEHIDSNGDKITTVTKEEVLKCKDGYDGPNYWELFAQFYYADLTTPAYCRQYARPDHPFKTPGMMCLSEKGVWEVR